MHKKDRIHFGTAEGVVGPLEAIFRQLDFKPLVFGTFAESNTNVKEFIDTAVEYGVEHMGRTMGGNKGGGGTHGAAEEVPDSTRDGNMEGICKLGRG